MDLTQAVIFADWFTVKADIIDLCSLMPLFSNFDPYEDLLLKKIMMIIGLWVANIMPMCLCTVDEFSLKFSPATSEKEK